MSKVAHEPLNGRVQTTTATVTLYRIRYNCLKKGLLSPRLGSTLWAEATTRLAQTRLTTRSTASSKLSVPPVSNLRRDWRHALFCRHVTDSSGVAYKLFLPASKLFPCL